MAERSSNTDSSGASAAKLGNDSKRWQVADALRGSRARTKYKHLCLGPLFLKYISDAFEEWHAMHVPEKSDGQIGSVESPLPTVSERSRTHFSLSDTLLPQLISGELRVKRVERSIKENA